MSDIIASEVLANGLRTDFWDTYSSIRNRQADSRLSAVMDLGVPATNREHKFGYFEAAPHMDQWVRGTSIPTDGFDSVSFTVPVYTWGRRVKWHNEDREDDQTQSLFDVARMCGESAALMPERFFFDLITGTEDTLPAIPNAPDGAAMFAGTDGDGADRFGVSGGNTFAAAGQSLSQIQDAYYKAMRRFKEMQDGKGQPLLGDSIIDRGCMIIHSPELQQKFEQIFMMSRPGAIGGGAPSNVIDEANRSVDLWCSSRLTGNSYYIFLKGVNKKPTFYLDRQGVQEESSLRGDNNGDLTRDTGEEYLQWYLRSGAGISLPYGAIKVT
tara:strand:- start:1639 stop:2616 length:978 start_codon:yes stop_codon:yes gene_type:complete